MKVLVTPTSFRPDKPTKALEELQAFCKELVFNPFQRPLKEEELIPLLKDCDGYLAGLDFITKNVIDSCPGLKVISRYGIGYDRVDIAAAQQKGIIVTNTPGANSEAVAELAFGMALALSRKLAYLDTQTKSNKWIRSNGMELKGKTIGIVGLGAIGKNVARFAKGFSMKVTAFDVYTDETYCDENDIKLQSFEEVITKADVISLHLPLTEETKYIINEESIDKMKHTAILINTSRGGLIHEGAVYQALKEGKLGGLGLDAFENEPPTDSPLFTLDNVIVTPHTGAHTLEATENMANMAVRNLIDVLSGKECKYLVG